MGETTLSGSCRARLQMTNIVIYIPGMGDDTNGLQSAAIKVWRLYGVQPIMHEMPWMDADSWQSKFERLLALIEKLSTDNNRVSLVGVSAGAGAAINAFAARPDSINKVVCIVGKINNPDDIGPSYRKRSPAFYQSALKVQFSLDKLAALNRRKDIMSRYAIFDETVRRQDSIVLGGINTTVCSVSHVFTIVEQILFGALIFIRFLKHKSK